LLAAGHDAWKVASAGRSGTFSTGPRTGNVRGAQLHGQACRLPAMRTRATLATMEPSVSEDEYLPPQRETLPKTEFVNGRMTAMSGASVRHNGVVANLIAALGTRLRGSPCRAHPSDLRVHVPATGLYTYPDVLVVCGAIERAPRDSETILNPRILI